MIRAFLLLLLRVYRATLSPLMGNVCRFEPSCSRYASVSIEHWGAARGSWLAAKRLCKCHPFHPGGYDPPPLPPPPRNDAADAPTAPAGHV